MPQQLHAEGARPPRNLQAHAAHAHNAQRLTAQLRALQRLLLPLARVHRRIRPGHHARQRNHQAQRQLRYSHRITARRVHHHNAVPRRRLGVDVVHADTRAANHAQLRRAFEQLRVHLHRRAHHQRLGICQLRLQTIFDLVMRHHLPLRRPLKHCQRRRRNLLSQYNFHRLQSHFCFRRCSAAALP